MEAYTTEEQQVEAIKKYWKENGTSIIVGAAIAFAGIWGWRYYSAQQMLAKETASEGFQASMEALAKEEPEIAVVEKFISENKENSYAVLAALQLAKSAADKGDLEAAAKQLQFVIDTASQPQLKSMASFRLARVKFSQKDFDGALSLVNQPHADAFKAIAEELKGDIFVAQGNSEQARLAYQAAADVEGAGATPSLQMKIDNLAELEMPQS